MARTLESLDDEALYADGRSAADLRRRPRRAADRGRPATDREHACADGRGGDESRPQVTSATPIDRSERAARSLNVTIVAANPFEFDSRFLRSAVSLAEDRPPGHGPRLRRPGLPRQEALAPGVRLIRLEVDRPLGNALRPLPEGVRTGSAERIGVDPAATVLPPDKPRGARSSPASRPAGARRSPRTFDGSSRGPTRSSRPRPTPDVFHRQSLVVLPVAHGAHERLGRRSSTTSRTTTPRPSASRGCRGSSRSSCVAASGPGSGTRPASSRSSDPVASLVGA